VEELGFLALLLELAEEAGRVLAQAQALVLEAVVVGALCIHQELLSVFCQSDPG
jgi:hypothetical protein